MRVGAETGLPHHDIRGHNLPAAPERKKSEPNVERRILSESAFRIEKAVIGNLISDAKKALSPLLFWKKNYTKAQISFEAVAARALRAMNATDDRKQSMFFMEVADEAREAAGKIVDILLKKSRGIVKEDEKAQQEAVQASQEACARIVRKLEKAGMPTDALQEAQS